ncbi:MAG: hypothetical protein B5M54_06100 [Candidatus Aminicenantes bacterium 4484_214]|nr:MAG: hypothetical protein B5M54_06100 [Candidatus Aminicenantes bacterium 4484_214]
MTPPWKGGLEAAYEAGFIFSKISRSARSARRPKAFFVLIRSFKLIKLTFIFPSFSATRKRIRKGKKYFVGLYFFLSANIFNSNYLVRNCLC